MASTYVNDLRLEEMATGDQSGSWGTTTNTNLELIGEAFGWGTRAIANASTDNITIADGASDADRSMALKLTGGGQACTVTLLPNTSSKVWVMENATSYTLTFTQGSGANVAILAGETKMIATDGGGSGAVVYDVLTDLNLAGTTKAAALTVSGNSDFDGDLDVDGTTNLDVVDIDGAVDFASTTAHAGNATFADSAKVQLGAGADLQIFYDGSNAFINNTVAGSLSIKSDDINLMSSDSETMAAFVENGAVTLYHDNSAKLATAAAGVTVTGTFVPSGVVTANAGVVVDEMTLDGDTLTATDTFTIDAVDDITLNSDNSGRILFGDASVIYGIASNSSSDFVLEVGTNDKDMLFKGQDGGSAITALTLDMSAAGAATFNNDVTAFSDERLKSDITTIPDALSKVSEMRGVHYVRNETGKNSSGVIAQELQKIAPELVLTAEDEMGTLSVNYGNITGYLIEAIKELKAEIEELKAR